MRSRAPPVADAARWSIRSGRKNRASEQREDFFGHRKAVGADAPAATLGAYLCAVRTMLQHRSYPALQATERGSSRGNLSPLTVFWFLLYAQKERLRGERCLLCLCKRLRDADRREDAIAINVNPSVSLAADSLSLRLGHGAADSFILLPGFRLHFHHLLPGARRSLPHRLLRRPPRGGRGPGQRPGCLPPDA